ncbi:MAG: HAMP domain-containing sensor histidine kinase [Gaiellaceae bacterium]
MNARSLRARSVAAATLAILLALVIVGIGVQVLASRHLHRSLDSTLRSRAVDVAQLSASAPALLTMPGSLDSSLRGGTQLSVEVFDRRGRIVARSLSLGGRVLDVGAVVRRVIESGHGAYASTGSGDERERVYAAPLAEGSSPAAGGAVLVAASLHDVQSTLSSLRLFLFAAGAFAALLGAVGVAVLMRRALHPLERLAGAAAEIERTGDPSRRLPQPAADDEVGRLAETLNAMLASLERAREGERRFLADASHELRTPLTALRGNVDYLARHGATPEVVADLREDAERLAQLADDLLALSHEEAAAPPSEPVRLDEVAVALDGVEVVAPDPVAVRGDRAAIARALENLVANARRHGPAGGRVTVEVAQQDGLARLSVVDEGAGLTADEAAVAFGRFWRGSGARQGSGLGLAIVAATAERHGGRAYAEGARFTIELPALRDLSESVGTTKA